MYTNTARSGRCVAILVILAVLGVFAEAAEPPQRLSSSAWQQLLSDPATPPAGAPRGSSTLVEYFDYECPTCRALEPTVARLLIANPNLRLVRKDWPIFGEVSAYAAMCSFAAASEGNYQKAHDALIGSKADLDTKDDVRRVLRAAGFDVARLDADVTRNQVAYLAVLHRNEQEATQLGLRGTPGFVLDGRTVSGSDITAMSRSSGPDRAH